MIRSAFALAVWAATAGLAGAAAEPPRLVLDGTASWRESVPGFGGFSALHLDADGVGFVALTDRGDWARGRLVREDVRLTGAELTAFGQLLGVNGTALTGDAVDAEGIAVDPRGRIFVSFEGFHRIRRYDSLDAAAIHVDGHPEFPALQNNSALEALAIDAAGTLYAIPERSGDWERPFPVYRLRDGIWDRQLSIPRSGRFLVTGADFGPDGRLYLLERDNRLASFATRVRSFSLGPDGFDAGITLLETGFGELDNMEAISVWRDGGGRIRVTLLSDDNFFPLQRTMFAEYVMED